MDEKLMLQARKLAQEALKKQSKDIDYKHMTAPCGLPCFTCYAHLAGESVELREVLAAFFEKPLEQITCKGCRGEGGKCVHLPMPCRVYPCAQEKGVTVCSQCADFPCDFLHPYSDQAHLYHNTKVFNLCLIKKMGLEQWAKTKAAQVLDTYSFCPWTL